MVFYLAVGVETVLTVAGVTGGGVLVLVVVGVSRLLVVPLHPRGRGLDAARPVVLLVDVLQDENDQGHNAEDGEELGELAEVDGGFVLVARAHNVSLVVGYGSHYRPRKFCELAAGERAKGPAEWEVGPLSRCVSPGLIMLA
jgi:hypothetical protein